MTSMPDRINIDKKDRELYDKLEEIFQGKTRKEQFLFAMAIGFKNNVSRPLGTKEGFFLVKDLRPEDEALLDALAIFEEGPEILSNKEKIFRIAEEYAHAGIRILADEITSSSFGSFVKKFEKELFELFEKINQGNDDDEEKNTSG